MSKRHEDLIAFLTHTIESAKKEQAGFGEAAAQDVKSAIQWRAEGALVAWFTEHYGKIALELVKHGQDLLPIYENLIDALTMLASGNSGNGAEIRAIAVLARALKDWL